MENLTLVKPKASPYYLPQGEEESVLTHAYRQKIPLLLKGPTGCGKSRFVEKMAHQLNRPLITVACNEDTSASDLVGRYLVKGGETVWQDGPVTRAIKTGSFLYLDEIAEAREDVVVLIHSLTDHRRELYIDRLNEVLKAPSEFMLLVSFNPGYQSALKEMKPSTRQRFIALNFNYPILEAEIKIVMAESACTEDVAKRLCKMALKMRAIENYEFRETVSTRLIVYAAKLIVSGLSPRLATTVAVSQVMTDDPEALAALNDIVSLTF
ncbi:CbbQ/NirQ/NorQ/GpvN family protein [bacterium]|nr:CbbQ/NirQ/NorQ/GpvN family protein [bacterium]